MVNFVRQFSQQKLEVVVGLPVARTEPRALKRGHDLLETTLRNGSDSCFCSATLGVVDQVGV